MAFTITEVVRRVYSQPGYMHQRAPAVFFGRHADVSATMRRLRQAVSERGPALFVAGDSGIGKSSFLRACAKEADGSANILSLDGRSSTDASTGLLSQILERIVPSDLSRGMRSEALHARLAAMGKRRPILVLLDDFDKVAPEALEIVDDLIDAAKQVPALIVASLQRRSLELSPVAAYVHAALAKGSSKHFLPPLGCAEVRLLAWNLAASRGCELDASVTAEIIASAEGNPRFVHELISQVVSESPPFTALIPASAIAAIGTFKAAISGGARDVLSVASLIGERFCGSWLVDLTGQDESIVTDALQAACDAGFLLERPGAPDHFVFSQYAVRKAFSTSLVSRRRESLHVRIAQMLVQLEVKAPYDTLVAEHLAAAGASSAPAWLHKVGSRMLDEGEGVAAAEFYERAARLVVDSTKRIELLSTSADAYAMSGMFESTIFLREELAQLLRADSADDALAKTLLSLFFDYALAERWADARRTVEELNALGCPDHEDTKIYANMAWAIHLAQRGDVQESRSWFECATAWSPTCCRGRIMQLLGSAVVYSRSRPFQKTMEIFDQAVGSSIEASQPRFTAMSQILAFEIATTLGRMREARNREAACRLALADLQQYKNIRNSHAIREATFRALSGELDAARDALCSILAVPNPGRGFESFTRGIGTFVAARTGDPHMIQSLFDPKLLGADTERHDAEAWGVLLRGFSEVAAARGLAEQLSSCVHRLVEANFVDPHLWIQLTTAQYGKVADLPTAREQIIARRGGTDRLVIVAGLAMFDAYSARRQGRRIEAKQEAHRAAEAYEALEWPIFQALALEIAGKPGAAATLYMKCGASADLKRLRAPATRNKRRGVFSAPLTLREREVATLVERGLTNREIATALRASEQTVHHHVTAILGKLGLRSRWQVTSNPTRREP